MCIILRCLNIWSCTKTRAVRLTFRYLSFMQWSGGKEACFNRRKELRSIPDLQEGQTWPEGQCGDVAWEDIKAAAWSKERMMYKRSESRRKLPVGMHSSRYGLNRETWVSFERCMFRRHSLWSRGKFGTLGQLPPNLIESWSREC